MSERLRVLGIPSPRGGDEYEPIPWTYRWWFRLYVTVRRLRHAVGLHDWRRVWPEGPSPFELCDWCGGRRHL